MRSRDGDCPFLRPIRTLVPSLLLLSILLQAQEYLISYRYVVKDAMLYNENLYISPAMTPCHGVAETQSIVFENTDDVSLKKIIQKNFDTFLEYIHALGLHVEHTSHTQNMQNSSTTVLTLKTTCFKVDFNDNSVKISALK